VVFVQSIADGVAAKKNKKIPLRLCAFMVSRWDFCKEHVLEYTQGE
jgi:hypothetical protein